MELLLSDCLPTQIYRTDERNSWAYISGSIQLCHGMPGSATSWFLGMKMGKKWVKGLEQNMNEVSCRCESAQFSYDGHENKEGLRGEATNTAQSLLPWSVNFLLLTIQYKVSPDSCHTALFYHQPASRLWVMFNQGTRSYSWKFFLTQVTVPFPNRWYDIFCTV